MALFGEHNLQIAGFIHGKLQRDKFHRFDEHGQLRLIGNRLDGFKNYMGSDVIERDATWGICMVPHAAYVYCHGMWAETNPYKTDLRAVFEKDSQHVMRFMSDASESGIKVFAILTPGPRRDNKEIPEGVALDRVEYIDRKYREYLCEEFAKRDIGVVRGWHEAHDDAGWLKPEYCKHPLDQEHANTAYGEGMMRQILNYMNH